MPWLSRARSATLGGALCAGLLACSPTAAPDEARATEKFEDGASRDVELISANAEASVRASAGASTNLDYAMAAPIGQGEAVKVVVRGLVSGEPGMTLAFIADRRPNREPCLDGPTGATASGTVPFRMVNPVSPPNAGDGLSSWTDPDAVVGLHAQPAAGCSSDCPVERRTTADPKCLKAASLAPPRPIRSAQMQSRTLPLSSPGVEVPLWS